MKSSYIIIIISVLLFFGNTIFNGYSLDDELVTKNHPLTSEKSEISIIDLFSSAYQNEMGFEFGYRPVTLATFYIEHRLFGESAKISHTINLLLYLMLVLLLYKFIEQIYWSTSPYLLLFITLLFALHPIHSEVVASIKNRDEILSFLFLMLSLLFTLKWINKKQWYSLFLVALFTSLSILSKKSSVPILALIPAYLFYQKKQTFNDWLVPSVFFSIPLLLFSFNLNLVKGAFLFFGFYASNYLLFELFKILNIKVDKRRKLLLILPVIAVFFLTMGLFHQVELWYSIGVLSFIPLFFIDFKKAYIFSITILLVAFFLFNKQFYLMSALFTLAAGVFLSKNKLDFSWKLLILYLAILTSSALISKNYNLIFIYLTPIIILSLAYLNRYLPVILSVISIIIGTMYFEVTIFHLGLALLALLPFFIQKNHLYLKTTLSIFLIVTTIHSIDLSQYNSNLLSKEETSLNIENIDVIPEEGRKLEYVENTLVKEHSPNERLASGATIIGKYLSLLIYPKNLSFYYGFATLKTSDFSSLYVWLSILINVILIVLMVFYFNKNKLISFGIFWFFIGIIPFSNWFDLVAGILAERLAFISSFGFVLFIGGSILEVNNSLKFKINSNYSKTIAFALLVLLGTLSFQRNSLWASSVKLMSHDIKHLEKSAQANYLLAINSIKSSLKHTQNKEHLKQKVNFSIHHFKKAISIYPDFFNYHFDLARAYLSIEDYQKAKKAFLGAYNIDPNSHFVLHELSVVCFRLEEYNECLKYTKAYLKIDKSNTTIYELAAYSAYYLDQYELAIQFIKNGLEHKNSDGLLRLKNEIESKEISPLLKKS